MTATAQHCRFNHLFALCLRLQILSEAIRKTLKVSLSRVCFGLSEKAIESIKQLSEDLIFCFDFFL